MKSTMEKWRYLVREESLFLFMKAASRFSLECIKKSKLEIMPEIHF
ncbi:hypothetical protein HBP99_13080 [Listeria booriae]|uniref:Uncharacterized protein n=1 Tax=Listeria booriae TaxID=1552123 RepID=A0A841VYC7_9LIST|nr:hypothetical protein [Listeria booriae]MBC1228733.1 hypothetical protein [Listeria booriae]MBC1230819.1 hypothetical protein [Listeria booriae]MBC1273796.1 hypothetical protein [Listeria booriae]MBC1317658.1 hypothetical protein [Listeria booriae]MBC2369572.1 hypothetical protein [Listeria booriae]